MQALLSDPAESRSPLHSALALTLCIAVTALVLLPVAMRQTGSGGILGLTAASAICLIAAAASEFLGGYLHRHSSPLAALGVSMVIRTVPPLAVCFALAARGDHGREHLALVGYLFAFYFVTLIAETRFAVQRLARPTSKSDCASR